VNVLVDDRLHCVITDFGQSRLRSEVYRLTGGTEKGEEKDPETVLNTNIHLAGTTRWKAPEILAGKSPLTPQADVYAFAITCVEVHLLFSGRS
jgi:serine/threonine protein kinase